jgi:hypothetical protein
MKQQISLSPISISLMPSPVSRYDAMMEKKFPFIMFGLITPWYLFRRQPQDLFLSPAFSLSLGLFFPFRKFSIECFACSFTLIRPLEHILRFSSFFFCLNTSAIVIVSFNDVERKREKSITDKDDEEKVSSGFLAGKQRKKWPKL